MSDSDASGEKGQDKGPRSPSRPVTAAARRERRASARPTGKVGDVRPAGKARADGDKAEKTARETKDRPTPKRDRGETKTSLFSRLVRFIREVWAELRKVIWPNRKQMVTYTTVVLAFVVFMVALVSGLDFVVGKIISVVFGA